MKQRFLSSIYGFLGCVILPCLFWPSRAADSVCAKVGIELTQTAVATRSAFRATLRLFNDDPGLVLSNLFAEVSIRDAQGVLSNARFAFLGPVLDRLSGVDGTGVLPGGSSGSAIWTIVPAEDAAPLSVTEYWVGGAFGYAQNGLAVRIPLAPIKITVHPDAALEITYFHQRDVFSDDPFTDPVEPSQPFYLAVTVHNRGAGAAGNLTLSAPEPKIVDNEKGLLIAFNVLWGEMNGQRVSPSLSANFGDVGPAQRSMALWAMNATLQGHFTEYKAHFEYMNGLGEKRLSIFKDVSIHEMIHLVQAGGAFEDGKPDFLVSEVPDLRDLPDTLYLSDGSTNPVQVVEQAVHDGPPGSEARQVHLSAALPPGWVYLRVPEPSDGRYRLVDVRRSDGRAVALETNVWVTDRTFVGMGRRPIRENVLHLLDCDSTGLYTLSYEPVAAADELAPISQVAALPADSYRRIPVSWSGQDDPGGSGIAGYDVLVSANGGNFAKWLERTPLTGSIYFGELGNRYAFYSVAIDQAGNREAAPTTPDASTAVTLTNRAPVVSLATNWFAVPEGAEFALTPSTSDPDGSDVLTFSLVTAPPGMVISPTTGLIRWPTGEGTGPTTNRIVLRVDDNGDPALSTSTAFTVVVLEVNTPPALAAIDDFTIREGFVLTLANVAADFDLPANRLAFTLEPGAPSGAAIDSTNGVFRWRPTETQGPSTNRIAVVVTDNGQPPLSATQSFTVIVRDTLSDFTLACGSTNLLAGTPASVPLRLRSGADLTEFSFLLELPAARLTNLTLNSSLASVTSMREAPDRYRVTVQAKSGQTLQGDIPELLKLGFEAIHNPHSAAVPLNLLSVRGMTAGGLVLGNGQGLGGRVFVIGAEPMVQAFLGTNGMRSLVVYGLAGHDYLIQCTTNLAAGAAWVPWRQVHLDGNFAVIENVEASGPNLYYRAVELGASVPRLNVWHERSEIIIEWPVAAGECAVEETGSLSPPVRWAPTVGLPQQVGNTFRLVTPVGASRRYYRLACGAP